MSGLVGILQNIENKENQEAENRQNLESICRLKKKLVQLQDREQQLKQSINNGDAEAEEADDDLDLGVPQPGDNEAKSIFNIVKNKQKLKGLAYLTGITGWKQGDDEITFTFDPIINGKWKGTFYLRLKQSQGRLISKGHNFPHAVPFKKLYSEYLQKVMKEDKRECLAWVLKTLMRYLRAYLSREDQFKQMKEEMNDCVREVQALNNYTAIKIVLIIAETGETEADIQSSLKVSIFLNYSPDGERPLLGSLKVKVETEGEEELDHTEALVDQCQAFYTHRLKEAIIEAF